METFAIQNIDRQGADESQIFRDCWLEPPLQKYPMAGRSGLASYSSSRVQHVVLHRLAQKPSNKKSRETPGPFVPSSVAAMWAVVGAGLLVVLLASGGGVAAQRPPKQHIKTEQCSIRTVFAKLSQIKSSKDCQAGCAGGKCPRDWYPRQVDHCNVACGKVFEPLCKRDTAPAARVHDHPVILCVQVETHPSVFV
jgi:hypothetical protein